MLIPEFKSQSHTKRKGKKGGKERGREREVRKVRKGGREERRKGGKEEGREGGREGRRKGGKEECKLDLRLLRDHCTTSFPVTTYLPNISLFHQSK
jgi:hypothetical protein